MPTTNSQTRPRQTPFAALALAAAALAVAGDVQGAIVRLKSRATVTASVVLLSDVADVFERDPATAEALKNVPLRPAPAAGTEEQIDFSDIRNRLHARGFSLADLEFTGKSSVKVLAPADEKLVSESPEERPTKSPAVTSWQMSRARDLLAKSIENYLRTAELGEVNVEVKLDAALAPLVISGQTSGYEIRGGRPPWDQWQPLAVRFIDRDEQLQSIRVETRVAAHPFVLAARRPLPRGHVIGERDVEWKQVDSPAGTPPAADALIGSETLRPLRAGQEITAGDVRQVPLVRRGDVVTALASVGGITVKRQLRARSDGSLGETVTLEGLDRRDQLEATVVGYHEVQVLGGSQQLSADDVVRGQSAGRAAKRTASRGFSGSGDNSPNRLK